MKNLGILFGVALVLAMATTSRAQSFLTNGLVAYYPLNRNANDVSGNGNNGTVYGATLTTDRFGNPNAAYYFNGSSAYITVPISSTAFSNDFTASVWFDAYDITNAWPTLFDEQGNSAFREGIVGLISEGSGIGALYSYSTYPGPSFAWYLERNQQTPLNNRSNAGQGSPAHHHAEMRLVQEAKPVAVPPVHHIVSTIQHPSTTSAFSRLGRIGMGRCVSFGVRC